MFKKKSKPIVTPRTRETSPEQENGTTQAEESPSTLASKLKKAKRAKPKARLSFGGDDEEGEGEVFQVKKSSLSRKLALGSHPASPRNIIPSSLDQASISPRSQGGPTYDQAYLNQLKASTPTSRPNLPGNDSYDADMSMSMDVDMSMDSVESLDVFGGEDLLGTVIPSESSIKVAKERRERLRATGVSGEDDFISLSVTRRADEPKGPHPDSRLVREDDELGEGDDEFAEYTSAQERIALGKKSRKVEASKRRDAMKDMIADAEEEDDETIEWEQEQLRRGGHTTPDSTTKAVPVKQTYKPAPIPAAISLPTLPPTITRLTASLSQLTTSHLSNTAALNALAEERKQVEAREKEMRDMVGKAEEKRGWFGSFREWVEGVAGFLDEKFPELEKVEDEHVSLLHERLDIISKRRRADDEDDLSTFLGSLPTPASEPEIEETDDFGQAVPKPSPALIKQERRTARIARRTRRHHPSQQHRRRAPEDDEEGYSTDSSLPPPDATSYRAAIQSLSKRSTNILSDVRAAEFKDPSSGNGKGLGEWWGEWRMRYADSYVGAWGGLGLVGAWEFWVRLEIVGWDFIEDPSSLDHFKWYASLYEYSRPVISADTMDEGERELGPDGDLVSAMISTAIIPRLCKMVAGGVLDVYSDVHIRRMIDLAEEVEASVESGNSKFQMLLKSIHTAFQAAVTETESLIEQYTSSSQHPRFDPESIPARRRFLARRVKLLRNLIRWRKYTGERFGVGALATRILKGCVLPIAEGGWEVGGEEIVKKVVVFLPSELIPYEMTARLASTSIRR